MAVTYVLLAVSSVMFLLDDACRSQALRFHTGRYILSRWSKDIFALEKSFLAAVECK